MSADYFLICVAIMGVITFMLRALPFIIPKKTLENKYMRELSRAMPLMVMVILVLHSLMQSDWSGPRSAGTIMLLCIAMTAGFQWYMKIPILSIVIGSSIYIIMVNGYI